MTGGPAVAQSRGAQNSSYHDDSVGSDKKGGAEEEGVEVVLDSKVTKVMDSPDGGHRTSPNAGQPQNVFRPPPAELAVRPRATRPPSGSGSFPAPPRNEYQHAHHPMTVPYNPSGSFEDGAYYQQHHSPHVHYPQAGGRYPVDDVNVISPSHGKGDSPERSRHPHSTQSRGHAPPGYYQYPPTSPVSRPGAGTSSSKHPGARPDAAPYSSAGGQPYGHPDDGTWNSYPPSGERPQPPIVNESSFDSEPYASSHHSQYSSHPGTPSNQPYAGAPPTPLASMPSYDPNQQFYGGGGSWGSFDSGLGIAPPQFDSQQGYYGYPANPPPYSPPYSPGAPAYAYGDPYATPYPSYAPPYPGGSYDEGDQGLLKDYHPDHDGRQHYAATVTPGDNRKGSGPAAQNDASNNRSESGMLLPNAAYEVDFEVTNPPREPVMPPSVHPVCFAPGEINEDDVLCGRGGGTNSQIGNRRFRKLVQDFQPTYLLARRKEKPLLARTIVLIIRKRGGRFLKKNDDTGELFEVGDAKAEAKTSQALREGLDVRATKSAASSLMDKKKKKGGRGKAAAKEESPEPEPQEEAPEEVKSEAAPEIKSPPKKMSDVADKRDKTPPPNLPALKGGEGMTGLVHPHSPEALQFRKRRRMRSGESIPAQDKFFPDFCPPRADLCRTSSPNPDGPTPMNLATTPPAKNSNAGDDDEAQPGGCQPGCAGIAMDIVLGAATGGFCLGPKWRSSN